LHVETCQGSEVQSINATGLVTGAAIQNVFFISGT
jgi:hypothetical protein